MFARATLTIVFFSAARASGAATITVTGNGDTTAVDGAVTLQEAITSINNGANVNADVVAVGAYGTNDTINFAIGTGVQTIAVGFQLPAITKPVVINGTTQPGFAGTPLIVLDGIGASAFARGLQINGGNSTVRGLVIIRFFDGISLSTNGGNLVAGNYIGIDSTGTLARGNTGSGGVLIELSSNGNTIGGTTVANRNVISGNATGIFLSDISGTVIQGNYIGTNAAGTAAVANGFSIDVFATDTTIGGTTGTTPGGPCTGACNLISGNTTGPFMETGFDNTQLLGNLIGTNAAGTGALGNASDGIVLNSNNNTVGGLTASAMNVVAFNGGAGVNVSGTGNVILGNSIFSNNDVGIDLNNDGKTSNDDCDPDTGSSNNLQNFPVITSASIAAGQVTISGTLNSLSSKSFRIEFFSSASCDPSGNGEGRTFLGFTTVTTGVCAGTNTPNGTFGPVMFSIPAGQTVVTATATLLAPGPVPVETSEFSACFTQGTPPTNTPTSTPTSTPTKTPTNTPAGVATNTPTTTPTSTPTSTPTNTPASVTTNTPASTPTRTPTVGQGPAAVVPTLSFPMLGLLALALAAAAIFLFRRS